MIGLFMLSFLATGAASTQTLTHNVVHINQTVDAKIAIVYSTGGLGDLSFNDAAKRGIESAIVKLTAAGKTIEWDEACTSPCDIPDITDAIEDFASSATEYDLIIGIGSSSGDGITASATAHTDRDFLIIDSVVDLSNVRSIIFKVEEGSFLVGAMAAMVSFPFGATCIAFLGGLDNPLTNRYLAGYEHGARYIEPDIEVRATYAPDPTNPYGDLEGGAIIGEIFLDIPCDVIFAVAGDTGIGVFNAVADWNVINGKGDWGNEPYKGKAYAIGVDSDQDHLSEGDVLVSMIKKVDVAVEDQTIDATYGNWTSGTENRGIAENGVGISAMTYTQTEANAVFDRQRDEYGDIDR